MNSDTNLKYLGLPRSLDREKLEELEQLESNYQSNTKGIRIFRSSPGQQKTQGYSVISQSCYLQSIFWRNPGQ